MQYEPESAYILFVFDSNTIVNHGSFFKNGFYQFNWIYD